jgi:hypothetical protein
MDDRELLFESMRVLWSAGLFNELPIKVRNILSEDEELVKFLTTQESQCLDLRLTYAEYEKHFMRLFNCVEMHQEMFYKAIIQTSYLMLLCEKNPMVANQLRESVGDKKLENDFLSLIGG